MLEKFEENPLDEELLEDFYDNSFFEIIILMTPKGKI
jgi:hypothetical protein